MVKWGTLFDAASATATVELGSSQLGQALYARSILLEINGGSTPNWTLDIQGRTHPSGTWHNINYFRTDQGAVVAVTASQLTVNWTTAQHYVIPNPPPMVRLVATRTGGTLTVYGAFSSEAYATAFEGPGTAAGSLGKAEDAVHTSGDVGVMALAVRADSAAATGANNDYVPLLVDTNGGLWVSQATLLAGEDLTNNRLMTMPSYSYVHLTADAPVKSGAGVVHTITMCSDAASTAGTLILYDSLTETGTIIATFTFIAAYQAPVTVTLDAAFATGLYAGFTTTADVNVTITYK